MARAMDSQEKGMVTMSNPIVTIEMESGGVMKAELYPDVAPNTVNNFISLVQSGFYDQGIAVLLHPGLELADLPAVEQQPSGAPGVLVTILFPWYSPAFTTGWFSTGSSPAS